MPGLPPRPSQGQQVCLAERDAAAWACACLCWALPVVTAPAAYAAGAAHMERHISGRPDTVASLWADFKAALPGSWKFGLMRWARPWSPASTCCWPAPTSCPGAGWSWVPQLVLAIGLCRVAVAHRRPVAPDRAAAPLRQARRRAAPVPRGSAGLGAGQERRPG